MMSSKGLHGPPTQGHSAAAQNFVLHLRKYKTNHWAKYSAGGAKKEISDYLKLGMTVQAGPGGNFSHFLLSTGGSSSKVNGFQHSQMHWKYLTLIHLYLGDCECMGGAEGSGIAVDSVTTYSI